MYLQSLTPVYNLTSFAVRLFLDASSAARVHNGDTLGFRVRDILLGLGFVVAAYGH